MSLSSIRSPKFPRRAPRSKWRPAFIGCRCRCRSRSTTSTCGWSRKKTAGRWSTPGSATRDTRALWEQILAGKAREAGGRHALSPGPRRQRRLALPALRRRALDDAGRIPDGARGAHVERRLHRPTRCSRCSARTASTRSAPRRMRGRGNRYAALVPEFPLSYRRIIEGDEVAIGKHALARDHRPRPCARAPVAVLRST